MLAIQGGRCAICCTADPGGRGVFHVDHDHGTGALRGLLCWRCNVGIGHLRESPEVLTSAIAYLAHHGREAAANDAVDLVALVRDRRWIGSEDAPVSSAAA